jgi:hypothetical protein
MQLRTWDDFREELVLSYQADRRAKKTITKLKQVFDEMAEFVTTTADLTFQNLQRWKLSRPNREPITFNGLMAYLRAICNQAIAYRETRSADSWLTSKFGKASPGRTEGSMR